MDKYIFHYDLKNKQVLNECTLTPREAPKETFPWLYAWNSRYESEEDSDEEEAKGEDSKTGKWMLFVSSAYVNDTWKQIKEAIQEGHLWNAKVSTCDPKNKSHAIMIYTHDYTDLEDVVSTLDYLETSGIKTPTTVIRYKTDKQTMAGVYRGGKEKPWIYASDTIRNKI